MKGIVFVVAVVVASSSSDCRSSLASWNSCASFLASAWEWR